MNAEFESYGEFRVISISGRLPDLALWQFPCEGERYHFDVNKRFLTLYNEAASWSRRIEQKRDACD